VNAVLVALNSDKCYCLADLQDVHVDLVTAPYLEELGITSRVFISKLIKAHKVLVAEPSVPVGVPGMHPPNPPPRSTSPVPTNRTSLVVDGRMENGLRSSGASVVMDGRYTNALQTHSNCHVKAKLCENHGSVAHEYQLLSALASTVSAVVPSCCGVVQCGDV
jgi:hypothetical protein